VSKIAEYGIQLIWVVTIVLIPIARPTTSDTGDSSRDLARIDFGN